MCIAPLGAQCVCWCSVVQWIRAWGPTAEGCSRHQPPKTFHPRAVVHNPPSLLPAGGSVCLVSARPLQKPSRLPPPAGRPDSTVLAFVREIATTGVQRTRGGWSISFVAGTPSCVLLAPTPPKARMGAPAVPRASFAAGSAAQLRRPLAREALQQCAGQPSAARISPETQARRWFPNSYPPRSPSFPESSRTCARSVTHVGICSPLWWDSGTLPQWLIPKPC